MAILSVGEIAILLGNSYDSFEDFLFSPQGERFKYRWDRYNNFDMGQGSRVRIEMNNLVNLGIITRADCDAVFDESDRRDDASKPKLVPLQNRPIVTLFDHMHDGQTGKGYQIQAGYMKVRQEHAPALSGIYLMTSNEAQKLADFIADKMFVGLSPAVTPYQIQHVWDGTKTNQSLIDEEMAEIGL